MHDDVVQFAAPMSEVSLERRTISGTIASAGVETQDGRGLIIAEGALLMPADLRRVKLLRHHDSDSPVGFMTSYDPSTMTATFSVPETAAGTAALEEAAAGLRDGLSVGIVWDDAEDLAVDREAGTVTVLRARVLEVSLVSIPAFADARVADVTASALLSAPDPQEPHVSDITIEQIQAAIDETADDLQQKFTAAIAGLNLGAAEPAPSYADFGAFVKALSNEEPEALELHAAMQDPARRAQFIGTVGDTATQNAWIGDAIHLVDERRRLVNFFTREGLPAEGMTMEYAVLESNSIAVGKQAAEGETIAYGEVKLTTSSTSVDTYGGYTTLSRQVIDRASNTYLNTVYRAQLLAYAKATEAATATKIKALIAGRLAGSPLVMPSLATASATDWIGVLVDAVSLFDDRGYAVDGLLVSKDVFKRLAGLETAGGDRLMGVFGTGVNQVGEIGVRTLSGNLASIHVQLQPALVDGTATFADQVGFTTWESGGPTRLSDEDITKLTEATSVYGYLAGATQFPGAVEPIKFAA